ncbi:MAG: hemolysin family protein [Clostridiales bacterium]|nr:hemolysin family protein [Clostridiales bacterium]
MTFYWIACIVCLCLSAFFSASEMAFSSLNRLRMENAAEDGSRRAQIALKVADRFDNTLSAILIGNNFVNIAFSSVSSIVAIRVAGEQWTWLATVIATVTVILFGETTPKILAKKNANRLALSIGWIIRGLTILLTPLIWIVLGLVHLITLPFKGEAQDEGQDAAAQELQTIIETVEDEGVIDEERSELLQAALDFSEVSAMEAMVSRVDMEAIDIGDDWDVIRRTLEETSFSRLPVYEDTIDNIIGILYVNHYFKALIDGEPFDLRAILMKPCYVYKTVKLPAVLAQMRRSRLHMAIVTDEYGGSMGLITMEDVLEQIVGDIWDEKDTIEAEAVERGEGVWELDGDMVISDFLELIGRSEDDFETESATVGGWTLERFGAFPREGDRIVADGLEITVLSMDDGRRVDKVLVRTLPDETKGKE